MANVAQHADTNSFLAAQRSQLYVQRQQAAGMSAVPWDDFGWGGPDDPGPQTESLDPDNVGDIADEGPGHRG